MFLELHKKFSINQSTDNNVANNRFVMLIMIIFLNHDDDDVIQSNTSVRFLINRYVVVILFDV